MSFTKNQEKEQKHQLVDKNLKVYFENVFNQYLVTKTNYPVTDGIVLGVHDNVFKATIATDEVDHAVTKLSKGLDEIPNELIKLGRSQFIPLLHQTVRCNS